LRLQRRERFSLIGGVEARIVFAPPPRTCFLIRGIRAESDYLLDRLLIATLADE
jgi:hypothetical protein